MVLFDRHSVILAAVGVVLVVIGTPSIGHARRTIGTRESHCVDATSVVMNEMMTLNLATIQDEDGDYPDWIELYNGDSMPISLLGFGISDDADEPFKWVFPAVVLPPESFLLLFASGKDRGIWPGELHTNFSISAGGEEVMLSDPEGAVVDLIQPIVMDPDVSYGRVPDGGSEWWFFHDPTPGCSNGSHVPPQRADPPIFSLPPGFYAPGVALAISSPDSSAVIRFTLNGDSPSESSALYSAPLILYNVKGVRAACFRRGMLPSKTVSATYIVGFESDLPIVSVLTNPENLWSDSIGIYVEGPNAEPDWPFYGANYWQDWEIPVHYEFFEPSGEAVLSMEAGAKICGASSRSFPQKSLRIVARAQYGHDRIHFPMFPEEPVFSFKSLVLRNSGSDWWSSMMRDALMTSLVDGLGVATQAYRPLVVFLNGEYWGIHNMRERLDEFYLASHYGVCRDSVDIIENYFFPEAGDFVAYSMLVQYIEENDVSDPAIYDSVQTMMNIEDFIRYQAAEIYYANTDWPAKNIRCWRPKTENGRFRWMMYDTDAGFSLEYGIPVGTYDFNALEHAIAPDGNDGTNPPYATLLLRKLLENDQFRERFIVCSSDLMNICFRAERVLARIDSLKTGIENEMPRHEARWYSDHIWEDKLERMREFAMLRKEFMVQHLVEVFDLGNLVVMTLDRVPSQGGRVRLNGFLIDVLPWDGEYFVGSRIGLSAEPFAGYEFAGWEGIGIGSSQDSAMVVLNADTEIRALFEPTGSAETMVVITEINYHSADEFDPGDWVEIYAASGDHDLIGWQFRDQQDDHVYELSPGAVLPEGHYLILSSNREAFLGLYPDIACHVLGNLGFDLGNCGDQARLFDNGGVLQDSVAFDDESPWPVEPDGNGPTLQLVSPAFLNELASNWRASTNQYGDPGEGYGAPPVTAEDAVIMPNEFRLGVAYPNPFRTKSVMTICTPDPACIDMRVYDLGGRLVKTFPLFFVPAGRHPIRLCWQDMVSGAYLVRAGTPGHADQMRKVILIR